MIQSVSQLKNEQFFEKLQHRQYIKSGAVPLELKIRTVHQLLENAFMFKNH